MNHAGIIRFFDESFSVSQTESCELLIKVGPEEYSFAVLDREQNAVKASAFLSESLEIGIEKESFLKARYSAVKIAIETFDFTFIPQELFNEADIASYALFIRGSETERLIISHREAPGIKQVAAVNKDLFELLHEHFDKPEIFTQADSLIEAAFKISSTAGDQLFLNFNTSTFEALLTNGNKFQFYNIFKIETADDFNYFLLLILQQQGLNPQELECTISGEVKVGDERYNRIRKYFSAAKFAEMSEVDVLHSPDFASHRFFFPIWLKRMRIIGGRLKGLRLSPPSNLPVRPTTDLAKEALFNILGNRLDFEELKVLDLFSGTGNMSFEFASRGVLEVVSVDKDFKCYQYIRTTSKLHDLTQVKPVKADVFKYLKQETEKYNLIFADAPYDIPELKLIPQIVKEKGLLLPDGLLIVEHPSTIKLDHYPNFTEQRKYGYSSFSFFTG